MKTHQIHIEVEGQPTRTVDITKWPWFIGRDRQVDCTIDEPDVKKSHLVLVKRDERFGVKNLSDDNLQVNGKEAGKQIEIFSGDRITLTEQISIVFAVVEEDVVEGVFDEEEDDLFKPLTNIGSKQQPIKLPPQPGTEEMKMAIPRSIKPPPVGEERQGCPYCFRTLDSNDPLEGYQSFVQLSKNGRSKLYHAACWEEERLSRGAGFTDSDLEIRPYATPIQPRPLVALQKDAYDPTQSARNIDPNAALRLSTGRLVLTETTVQTAQNSFFVTNNSDIEQEISRYRMPAWAFVDYGDYSEMTEMVKLQSGEQTTVTTYVHPVHPARTGARLPLNNKQEVTLVVEYQSGWWMRIVIPMMMVLLFANSFFYIRWLGTSPNVFFPLFNLSWSWAVLWGLLYFLMPARFNWLAYAIISAIPHQRGDGFFKMRQQLWNRFASEGMVELMQNTFKLFMESLAVSVVIFVVSIILFYLLNIITGLITSLFSFFSIGFFLLAAMYIAAIFWVFNRLFLEYRFGLFAWLSENFNRATGKSEAEKEPA